MCKEKKAETFRKPRKRLWLVNFILTALFSHKKQPFCPFSSLKGEIEGKYVRRKNLTRNCEKIKEKFKRSSGGDGEKVVQGESCHVSKDEVQNK